MSIASTYFHTMDVSRLTDTEDDFGRTNQKYMPVLELQNINCGYSQSSRNMNTTRTESNNIIEFNPKVFCNPTLDIKTGDRISIKYHTRDMGEFTAGSPYIYDSHQEIPLMKKSDA